jgi:hypothetical protein
MAGIYKTVAVDLVSGRQQVVSAAHFARAIGAHRVSKRRARIAAKAADVLQSTTRMVANAPSAAEGSAKKRKARLAFGRARAAVRLGRVAGQPRKAAPAGSPAKEPGHVPAAGKITVALLRLRARAARARQRPVQGDLGRERSDEDKDAPRRTSCA